MTKLEKGIKLFLSIAFLICLLDMPYGYYELVRLFALVGFSVLAYKSYEAGLRELTFFYTCLAILFQPLLKVSLGRDIWMIVDLVVAVFLITSVFRTSKKVKE